MARQVLPIVGQAIGGYIGGPWGAMIGGMIGSALGNAIDPLVVKGPKLGEAGLQTSAEGVFRPIVLGTAAVKGNIITRGNRYIRIKREKQDKGSGPKTETERVYWTWAIRICEAPTEGPLNVLRVWQDEKLVFDATADSQIPDESYDFWQRIRYYDGNEEQLPDPDLEVFLGVGNVNAYRGTAYMVFPNWDLTDTGERIPDFRFEMSTTSTQATWDYTWGAPVPHNSGYQVGQVIYSTYWQRFIAFIGEGRRISPDGIVPFEVFGTGGTWVGAEHGVTKDIFMVINGDMWLSQDGGQSVEFVQAGVNASPSSGMEYIPEFGGFFFTMSANRSWVSSVTGLVWTSSAVIPNLGANPKWVRLPGGYFIAAGENGRVFRSANGLNEWEEIAQIVPPSGVLSKLLLESWSDTLFAAFTQGRIYRSIDGGLNWELVHNAGSGVDYLSGVCIPELRTTYINGHGSLSNNAVYTEDSGDTFTDASSERSNRWMAYAWAPELNTLLGVAAFAMYRANISSTTTALYLRDVVEWLCERPNLPAARFNTSTLNDPVAGVVFAEDYTCADGIRSLMGVFNFDASEHDSGTGYKLHFPKRGRAVEHVFTIDDLVDFPDKTVRQDAYERPRVLHMAYQSPKVGYAPAKASPSRFSPDVKVVGEVSVQVPVSFAGEETEAWRRADVLLKNMWTAVGGEEEFTIPDSFLWLVTSDAVGVSLRGQVRRMLITEQRYENGTLVCKFQVDRQSDYTSNLTGMPLPAPTPPPPSIAGPTLHLPLDLPALNDNNDALLSYHAATGQTSAWFGAQIERSTDGGANFEDMVRVTQNTIMGILLDALPDASPYYTDTTNVLRVRLYSDDALETLTQQQLLSEGGAIAVSWEDSGTRKWEVLQYRDAELDSNGDWLLSTLLRGRLNTEPVEHPSGSYFVLLDTVVSAGNVTAHINRELTYRATSLGSVSDGVPTYTEPYTGQSQREWPAAHLLLSRDGTVVSGRIVPRHRFGTEDMPVRSINWTGYTLRFQDAVDQVSTLEQVSDSFSFDAAGMTFPITVSVAQVNRITGAGPFVSEVIE